VRAALAPKKAKKSSGTKAGGATAPTTAAPAAQGTTGGAIGSLHSGYAANQADDLGSAC
jgi:polyisoprenyl-teichoic acid--peptidoglycan teichoic acid transferase